MKNLNEYYDELKNVLATKEKDNKQNTSETALNIDKTTIKDNLIKNKDSLNKIDKIINLVVNNSNYKGTGKAILGNGITLEKAEEIAFQNAQRDALEKFGVYVESETIVESGVVSKDEIKVITAGIVKSINKTASKTIENDVIVITLTSDFLIEGNLLKDRLNSYFKKKSESVNVEELVKKIGILEEKLSSISSDPSISSSDLVKELENIKVSYKNLGKILEISGSSLILSIKDKRKEKLSKIKDYLLELQKISDPDKLVDMKILGEPQIIDIDKNKINFKVNIDLKISDEYQNKIISLADYYYSTLYENEQYDKIKDAGSYYVFQPKTTILKYLYGDYKFPLALCLSDSSNKVIAISVYDNVNFLFSPHFKIYAALQDSGYNNLMFGLSENNQIGVWHRKLRKGILKRYNIVVV